MSGDKRVVFIPKEQVQRIEVRHGLQAESPLLQALVGLALIGIGMSGAASATASQSFPSGLVTIGPAALSKFG